MKYPLMNGRFAEVDEEDVELLSKHAWHVSSNGYAVRGKSINGKYETTLMHRVVMNPERELLIDHINGNKLDNRKQNLRLATKSQNAVNRLTIPKGAYFDKRSGTWYSRIKLNGTDIGLGTYKTASEAAKVYHNKRKELFGEFAR